MAPPKKAQPDQFAAGLAALRANLRKKFGAGAVVDDGELPDSSVIEVIPTGIGPLDNYVIGLGGLPVKRASEVIAPEAAGKSSAFWRIARNVQRMKGLVVLGETENAIDLDWAQRVHGADPDHMLILQPENIEEITAQIPYVVQQAKGFPGPLFFAWDSVAATPTKAEVAQGLEGKAKVAARALRLSEFGRIIGRVLVDHRCHLMMINQVRMNPGIMFGDKTVAPGGNAIKHLASLRLSIMGGKKVEGDEDDVIDEDGINTAGAHSGKDTTWIAIKNRMGPPWRKCRIRLDYGAGFDDEWSSLFFAMSNKKMPPRSQGEEALKEAYKKLGWRYWGEKGEMPSIIPPNKHAKKPRNPDDDIPL